MPGADVLARVADHPAARLRELLAWHWKVNQHQPPPDADLWAQPLAGSAGMTIYSSDQ